MRTRDGLFGDNRDLVKAGDRPQGHRDCLPSGLLVVPSLSKLKKNKERDNREQLVVLAEVGDVNLATETNKK